MTSGRGDELAVGAAAGPAVAVLESVECLVDELDLDQVPAHGAVDLLRVFDRMSRIADAARSLAAGQVAQSSLWKRNGHRSPAHWVAKECGIGVGDAVTLPGDRPAGQTTVEEARPIEPPDLFDTG